MSQCDYILSPTLCCSVIYIFGIDVHFWVTHHLTIPLGRGNLSVTQPQLIQFWYNYALLHARSSLALRRCSARQIIEWGHFRRSPKTSEEEKTFVDSATPQ